MNSGKGIWLVSKGASRLFLVSSVIVLATGVVLIVVSELFGSAAPSELGAKPVFYLPLIALLTVNAFSAFLLLVGMPWYWMRFDDSRRFVKLMWLGSFVILGWYSMSLYYFFVYRRQRPFAIGVNP